MGSSTAKATQFEHEIVAKGYTEEINDNDDIFASTPIFCVLRMLLVLALCNNWICLTGDISTAFLHAAAADSRPLYVSTSRVLQRLRPNRLATHTKPSIQRLRSSPKAWQNHLAEVMQQLGLRRLVSEPNVYGLHWGDQRQRRHLCINTNLLRVEDVTCHTLTTGFAMSTTCSSLDNRTTVNKLAQEHSATPFTPSNRRTHSRQHH